MVQLLTACARQDLNADKPSLLLGIVLPSRIRVPSFGVSRPTPSRSPKPKNDPLSKAMRSTEDMEDFAKRTEENKRFTIDVEDSREDN